MNLRGSSDTSTVQWSFSLPMSEEEYFGCAQPHRVQGRNPTRLCAPMPVLMNRPTRFQKGSPLLFYARLMLAAVSGICDCGRGTVT